jgi:hypothetical protein
MMTVKYHTAAEARIVRYSRQEVYVDEAKHEGRSSNNRPP